MGRLACPGLGPGAGDRWECARGAPGHGSGCEPLDGSGPIAWLSGVASRVWPTSVPSPTATPIPLPPDLLASLPPFCTVYNGEGVVTPTPAADCVTCPYRFMPDASTAALQAALVQAASDYQLPPRLLIAEAHSEGWGASGSIQCSLAIGAMQINHNIWAFVDGLSLPACGLARSLYSPYDLAGNTHLGAKLLRWARCAFTFLGSGSGTPEAPEANTAAWYYARAGLAFPDTTRVGGAPNPQSLCAAVAQAPATVAVYAALPQAPADVWSCPLDAQVSSPTVLDTVIASYYEGVSYVQLHGPDRPGYFHGVEAALVQAAEGG